MIHRAIFGSLERFFGILIENYAGDFPLWLAPVQLRLLPVSDEFRGYAESVVTSLTKVPYLASNTPLVRNYALQILQDTCKETFYSNFLVANNMLLIFLTSSAFYK